MMHTSVDVNRLDAVMGQYGLQIVTVGELLDGKRLDIPPVRQTSVTYKRAPRALSKAAEQGRIFWTED